MTPGRKGAGYLCLSCSLFLACGVWFPYGHSALFRHPTPPESVFLDSRQAESLVHSGGASRGHVVALPACLLLTSGLPHLLPQGEKSQGKEARDKRGRGEIGGKILGWGLQDFVGTAGRVGELGKGPRG